MDVTWVRGFNNMFSKIDKRGTPSYFSGGRFISLIREFDAGFPDYSQYMSTRAAEGKSTSRKDYYYDILNLFPETVKQSIVDRILEVAIESETVAKNNGDVSFMFIKLFRKSVFG